MAKKNTLPKNNNPVANTFEYDGSTYGFAGWVKQIKVSRDGELLTYSIADVLADAKLQEELVVMGAGYLRIV